MQDWIIQVSELSDQIISVMRDFDSCCTLSSHFWETSLLKRLRTISSKQLRIEGETLFLNALSAEKTLEQVISSDRMQYFR